MNNRLPRPRLSNAHPRQTLAQANSSGVEIKVNSRLHTVFVHLAPLFGFAGLDYRVEAENSHVVDYKLDRDADLLCLYPNPRCRSGDETTMRVNTCQNGGEATAISFRVKVGGTL